jgi:hypothetical protein
MNLCATLFVAAGNHLQITASGFTCGHDPVHNSKSSACVHIDDTKDMWYCHNCTSGGGPVEAYMSLMGVSRTQAEADIKAMGEPARAGRTCGTPGTRAPTDPQLRYLRDLGDTQPAPANKAEAHARIDELLRRRDASWTFHPYCPCPHSTPHSA